MSCSQDFHWIVVHFGSSRNLGQQLAVRAAEPKLAIGLSIELIALLVHGPVVPATEHGEIREHGGAPLGPVTDVMSLAESPPAARKTTAPISVVQRPA